MTLPVRFWRTTDKSGVTINLQLRRPSRKMDGDAVSECVGMTTAEYSELRERSTRLAQIDAGVQIDACEQVRTLSMKDTAKIVALTVFGESEGPQ